MWAISWIGVSISILTGFRTVQWIVLNSNHHVVDLVYEVITIKRGLIPAEELETQSKFEGQGEREVART